MKATTILSAALVAATQIYTSIAATPVRRASILRPSVVPVPDAPMSQGCYKSKGNMTMIDLKVPSTSAACNTACEDGGYLVLALYGGQCYGGFAMPPVDDYVQDDSKCNTPCPGYDKEACGGGSGPGSTHYFLVYNRGIDMNPPVYKKKPKTTSSSRPTSTSAPESTKTPSHEKETTPVAVITETAQPPETDTPDKDKKGGGANTVGIAVGVVVGVVVLGAIAGGLVFFMRRKRNAAIEEEHRRNAAVNAFISGSKPPSSHGSISMTDSRLDPVMAHRRMSDGSIADNEDYSRRILRVTNA